ncbi:MAG: peptidase M28 family protein [Flammeovirgaceae bacterium]|nr:peptidase M28 family protein [Flammeovirgaceae bacterium]MBR08438.1 peptidase M28 family protein [Rickettsiales bacterium]HCX24468.1 peptidase M28 family protein [Cytophagales bacterium]|tara:strand:+ start:5200 stop:6561 length:1362 start_codon:yes stop_codon:yes gene_type:complete
MKKALFLFLLIPALSYAQDHTEMVKKIYDHQLTQSPVYENLRYLCKEIGPRLSGSPQAAAAVEYTRQLMMDYGFDTVYLQPVMVPHWIRGQKEITRVTNSELKGAFELNSIALGNSVGTGAEGVHAEVIEVKSIEEVNKLGKAVAGKIVFYNGEMDPTKVNTFAAYGSAVVQRAYGASEAAKNGAKAVVIRSMTNRRDDIPHTGSLVYKPLMPKIPAVAISTNDADELSKLLAKQKGLKIYVETHCEMKEDILSYNVIGEIKGSQYPDEIITVGGHLDSWDVGEGAHDDGGGCMMSIEVGRTFIDMGIKPKRTLRVVMFMNEENGLRGGTEYARVAEEKAENHVAALESDSGSFGPMGFSSMGKEEQRKKVQGWAKYFTPYHVWSFERVGSGADISPLESQGVFLMEMEPNPQKYFNYHHTNADTFEAVDKRELELGAATMTSMIYLIDQEGI